MSTERQISANRENSKLSTGPRTEEGKATSSRNNTRHALTARGLIVLPGQESAFHELEEGLRDGLRPKGVLQETIFTRILECTWNMHRCRQAEASLYLNSDNHDVDPLKDEHNAATYTRIHKYARQNESGMQKAVRLLSKIQNEIQYRHEVYPLTPEQIEDPIEYEKTPHGLSAVCEFRKVIADVAKQQRSQASADRKALNAPTDTVNSRIRALGNPGFQVEPDSVGEGLESVRAAA